MKEDDFAHIGLMIDQVAREDPNFWTIVAQTQLDITKAVLRCELAQIMPAVVSALADLRKRIASRRFWIFIWDDTAFLLEPYKQLPFVDAQERKAAEFLMRRVYQYSKGKSHEPETETETETATIAYT